MASAIPNTTSKNRKQETSNLKSLNPETLLPCILLLTHERPRRQTTNLISRPQHHLLESKIGVPQCRIWAKLIECHEKIASKFLSMKLQNSWPHRSETSHQLPGNTTNVPPTNKNLRTCLTYRAMRLALRRNWLGSKCKSHTCSRNINKNREKSKWWEEFLVRLLKDLLHSLIYLLCATVLAVTVDSPVIVSQLAVPVKTASVLVVELDANAQPANQRDAWPHPGTIWFQSSPLLADQASTSHLLTAIWGTKVHLSRSNALKEDILSNQLLTTVLKDLKLNMKLRI